MLWLRRIEPFARPVLKLAARIGRGMTLGVQGVVVDPDGRVLLIQQTYTPGWRLPGGGVERDETAEQALARELVEEAGVELLERAELVSVHLNAQWFRGDHVLVYRVRRWRPCRATSRGEIHARGWFAPDAPPPDITPGTLARLHEAFGPEPASPLW